MEAARRARDPHLCGDGRGQEQRGSVSGYLGWPARPSSPRSRGSSALRASRESRWVPAFAGTTVLRLCGSHKTQEQ
ncbi:hypothetical protein EA658_17475 [Pseudoxanthomonas winnipegensis]|uniref:Uncharacterized protein n=1 Tax=Pseudoxanthomonas winnipegensis TaxID=2480810 RepID=A0ABY1WAM9_9GAMM|nr:hypothetical protein EA659_16980 [Pseudoxanthomonas winnipegensis]TAA17596.1 hypothetical protein EA658_17475 [Pseudoxanthomonas winnipegensis]TAH71315.1 hypothetical protein EA657_14015 [Pseudoxanthomonas winnipegensis]